MELAQFRMQKEANKHRRNVELKVGDWVYLKLRPYRQSSLVQRRNEKLAQRYFGLYQIVEKIGRVAYKLELPAHSNVHPVFHVSQLKLTVPSSCTPQALPPILNHNLEWATEPEALLDVRRATNGSNAEVLVQWKGLPALESTWETLTNLMQQFPDFDLEDKVALLRGSIDRLRIPIAFMKKKLRTKGRRARQWEKKMEVNGG
ncbi:PREDICTED: uncharacterized protein LOC104699179 [Camelina sativa]|uniref:Uncharacterized protein LOC104699179 n=1 Tax=Camelina sativa TaxID=90675 RepID=A0ABM0SL60_CAMSA|nr:PREDICTED: uncharacterized protein LOC104699179 [Camelina sativa]